VVLYNKLRLQRNEQFKLYNTYYNPIKEYGLDGISEEIINDKIIYHGIQCKLWNKTLYGKDLTTFFEVIFTRLMEKNYGGNFKGYLYHSGPLSQNVIEAFLNSRHLVEHKLEYQSTEQSSSTLTFKK